MNIIDKGSYTEVEVFFNDLNEEAQKKLSKVIGDEVGAGPIHIMTIDTEHKDEPTEIPLCYSQNETDDTSEKCSHCGKTIDGDWAARHSGLCLLCYCDNEKKGN